MVLIGATSLFIPAGRPFPNYETTLSTYPLSLSISPPNTEGIPSFSDGSLESASTTRSIRSLIHRFRSLSGVEYITGGMRLYGLRVVRASSYIEDRVDR